jgi:signal transduction histidine kinase
VDAVTSDPQQRWARWLVERNRRGTRILLWIHLALYPAFGLLDALLAPGAALPWLLGTRALVTVLTLGMFRVVSGRAFDAHGTWITPAFIVCGAGGISLMTSFMGGLASPYYAGLTLYLVAIGLLFVWPWRVVAVTYGSIVGSYVVVNVLGGAIGDRATAISNLAFLSATALTAGVGQVLLFRTHREQHDQRLRIEETTANLERAHAELKQLDAFKTRFFANMTHELRTPLAMVLTSLELMLEGEMGSLSDAQRSSLQTTFKSALKLLKLINDLLDLSRLEESRLKLAAREHDLVAHLRALAGETDVLAARKHISLAFVSKLERAPVWCDPERLERVFVNLLSNAVKFTPPGGHVTVSLADDGEAYAVAVQDDGPGFPPDRAEHLFERFYQVDGAATRQHGGTGIGLALARELVLLHGGAIGAWSDGKSGARFTVRLPKGHAHLRADAVHAGGAPAADAAAAADAAVHVTAGRDFRLLDVDEATERRVVDRDPDEDARPYTAVVVEDNPGIARLVHMTLRRQFKVLTAPDGLKGLELVGRERPHLVVSDLMMPGIDGLELTRRLREDPRTRHIPVLMLTARGEVDDRVKGLETGASAYLTKPFAPKELLSAARRLVHAEEETVELVLTQKMESLEIVAAGLAHEINNPLNYLANALARVRGDVEKIVAVAAASHGRALAPDEVEQLGRLERRAVELLGVADSGAKRIAGTVELMSRYGRAGYRREFVPHDAWEAVRTAVGVVLPATGRTVEMSLDLEGDGWLECVPEELAQLVTNLVQNAIEAVPEGTGSVRITGRGEEDVVLSVKDNGPGIPPEVRSRLFTPFFTTKGPKAGVGLGLTIARRVVQALGGSIHVEGAPGEGAEFVVRLPRRARAVAAPARA